MPNHVGHNFFPLSKPKSKTRANWFQLTRFTYRYSRIKWPTWNESEAFEAVDSSEIESWSSSNRCERDLYRCRTMIVVCEREFRKPDKIIKVCFMFVCELFFAYFCLLFFILPVLFISSSLVDFRLQLASRESRLVLFIRDKTCCLFRADICFISPLHLHFTQKPIELLLLNKFIRSNNKTWWRKNWFPLAVANDDLNEDSQKVIRQLYWAQAVACEMQAIDGSRSS